MKANYTIGLATLAALLLTSCFNEEVFDRSDKCRPTAIYVVNPLNTSTAIQGNVQWGDGSENDPDEAVVTLPAGSDLRNVSIQSIKVPSLATIEPDYRTIKDFTVKRSFWIVAENGVNRRRLDVEVLVGDYPRQIKYSELTDFWLPMGQFSDGNFYYTIGESGQFSPWTNTNVVAAILNKASCVPSNFPNPTGHVVLTTLSNGTAGATVGSGIASGNLFIGAFRSNSTNFLPRENQRKNSDQGIPFIYRPVSVTFEYKYAPGTQVEQWVPGSGTQKWVRETRNETDSMEMWTVLHKRVYDNRNPANTRYYRIGCGGYISSEKKSDWSRVTVSFHYGRSDILNIPTTDPPAYRVADLGLAWAPLWTFQYFTDVNSGENGPPVLESNSNDKWKYTTQVVQERWIEDYSGSDKEPTHLSMTFNSSAGGWIYKGAGADANMGYSGSKLEIRNVQLNY